ncbi:cactin isoform X2 [Aethina tumida]|uniref:cactin isoform X2 n=1 Tax=Aethina tumida TaxID=116153 RepID=UPI0021474B97|nr:cactin isoform X2 [Aethina tumida]
MPRDTRRSSDRSSRRRSSSSSSRRSARRSAVKRRRNSRSSNSSSSYRRNRSFDRSSRTRFDRSNQFRYSRRPSRNYERSVSRYRSRRGYYYNTRPARYTHSRSRSRRSRSRYFYRTGNRNRRNSSGSSVRFRHYNRSRSSSISSKSRRSIGRFNSRRSREMDKKGTRRSRSRSNRRRSKSRSSSRSRYKRRSRSRSDSRSRNGYISRDRRSDSYRRRSRSRDSGRSRRVSRYSRDRTSYGRSRVSPNHYRNRYSRSPDRRRALDRHSTRSSYSYKNKNGSSSRSDNKNVSTRSRSKSKCKDSKKSSESDSSSENSDSSSSDKNQEKSSESSSSDTDSSETSQASTKSLKLLEKLKEERLKQAEARRKQKELIKANETAEEKRIRRLIKKEAKERSRKEKRGWDNEYLHYTNSDNPFGDGNLLSTFVWNKKLAKEGLTGVSHMEIEARNRFKQEENKRELEKVKKRRIERELERQKREEEMQLMQRSKEAAQFEEWERQEDQFHLEQARLRSHIRIQDGRAKPIDLLAKYISAEEEVDAVEMHEPYTYLNGLHIKDLEDLVEDIKVYIELERGKNLDYWNDITIIVEDELQKLKKIQKDDDMGLNRREGIHQAVATDVSSVFKGKTSNQLAQLQKSIEAKLTGKSHGVDIGYWESLLSQLKAHMARARLRDRHQEGLRRKLQVLKAEQAVVVPSDTGKKPSHNKEQSEPSTADNSDNEGEEEEDAENDMLNECFDAYMAGSYSPKLLNPDDLEPGTIVVSEEDDIKRLEFARMQIIGNSRKADNPATHEEVQMQKEARKGMGDDEAQFSVESSLESQVYLWSDKYRPRKPRYFNRVHTGFEWNKYNQTHYDMDNPPPKIVQGYKFNIFYPDLIDKNDTPEYFLTPCPDNKEFAILRFHAGPPYEDIAFKIVNREWEYSYKRGFRCQFHNNIFQLWFHFKRYRYRR